LARKRAFFRQSVVESNGMTCTKKIGQKLKVQIMSRKYTFEEKVQVYLLQESGKSYREIGFIMMMSVGSTHGILTSLRSTLRELRPVCAAMSEGQKSCIRGIVSSISEKSLSLAERESLINQIGRRQYNRWYLSWKAGLLGERPEIQEDMKKVEVPRITRKEVVDEYTERIYWLQMENDFLKKRWR